VNVVALMSARLLLLLLLSLILILLIIKDKCSYLYLRTCSLTAKSSSRYTVNLLGGTILGFCYKSGMLAARLAGCHCLWPSADDN